MPEPLESGDELRVVHRHLAVEDKGAIEGPERGHECGEASGMVETVSAHQLDGPGDLVGQHPPAVYVLFIDPVRMEDGARYERRLHEGDGGEGHNASLSFRASGLPRSPRSSAGEGPRSLAKESLVLGK